MFSYVFSAFPSLLFGGYNVLLVDEMMPVSLIPLAVFESVFMLFDMV